MNMFFCTNCKISLEKKDKDFICIKCGFCLENIDGVYVDKSVFSEKDKNFYDEIYNEEKGVEWFQGLNRTNILKKILEYISLSYRRERFFKRNIKGKNNLILDLACGAGRDYLKNKGQVFGVDLSLKALNLAKDRYDFVIQSGVTRLPFLDNTFDYVTSSDFFGHVRVEDKDEIIKEIYRVLKPGGKTLHVIETDSTNIWFRIAHRDPVLFKKYFIEQIGGHVGLEMPMDCVKRWQKNMFEVKKKEKIWGTIWPIQYYKELFGHEYQSDFSKVNRIVIFSKVLSKNKLIREIINIILNPLNSLYCFFTNLDKGAGIMIIAKKPKGILDYGCGKGGNFYYLSKLGNYTGIDILSENILYAQKRYGEKYFKQVDVKETLLGEKTFDEIHSYDVLEHVEDLEFALNDFDRLLRYNGRIVITVPAEVSEKILKSIKANYFQEVGHLRIVDIKQITDFFISKGYKISKKINVRGMEAVVLSIMFFIKGKDKSVEYQTGSPTFHKLITAFIWIFDSRLFRTKLKYLFFIYIFTLPIGCLVSIFFPKSIYLVLQKNTVK